MIAGKTGFGEFTYNGEAKLQAYNPIGLNGWSLGINVAKSEFMRSASRTAVVISVFAFISVIVGIYVAYMLATSIAKPVKRLEHAAKEIANGNFNVNICQCGKDEVAMLASSFVKVKDTIQLITEKINAVSAALDKGDIDARIDNNLFKGEFADTTKAVNNIINTSIDGMFTVLTAYGEFGKGNFDVILKKFPGKKAIGNELFDALKANLMSVNTADTSLIDSAVDGKIDQRIDTSLYEGD